MRQARLAGSAVGPVRCTRRFERVLGGKYVQISALWHTPQGEYEEIALFGINADGSAAFWSFTSDGKQAQGQAADVTDIHPQALGFEALMPAGLARQAYWPADAGGFFWVVESRTQKGWNRFIQHHYQGLISP